MDNREILLQHKAKVQDTYPLNHTGMIIDYILTSSHLEAKLDWNPKFCPYDYIDNIDSKDMKSPIMWGIDGFDRLFVAMRTRLDGNPKLSVETVFQRYTGGKKWASGAKSPHHDESFGTIRLIHSTLAENDGEAFQNFMNLLVNGSVNVKVHNFSGNEIYKGTLTAI